MTSSSSTSPLPDLAPAVDYILAQDPDFETLTLDSLYAMLTDELKNLFVTDEMLEPLLAKVVEVHHQRAVPSTVVPQALGNEHINQVNLFLSQEGSPTDRAVWTAVAATGLPIKAILASFLNIRGGLMSQLKSAEIARPYRYLNDAEQTAATGVLHVGSQAIGPYTAMFVLHQVKDCQFTVTKQGLQIVRLGQKCLVNDMGLTIEGSFSTLFDKCTVDSKAVYYNSVPNLFRAARFFFQRYNVLYVAGEGWRLNPVVLPANTRLSEASKRISRLLTDGLLAKLKKVGSDTVAAVAVIEQALIDNPNAAALFDEIPSTPLSDADIQAIRDSTILATSDADIRRNFAYHTEHEKVRNTAWREPVWSNNATLTSAAPGLVKQVCEIVQTLDYLKEIVVATGTDRVIQVNCENGTESAWAAFGPQHGFVVGNATEKGAFNPIYDSCGNTVVIQHAFLQPDKIWDNVVHRRADAAPSVYMIRVKGDAITPSVLVANIGRRLPDHWRHVAAVKLGNFHNPNFYLVFTKQGVEAWKEVKIGRTADLKGKNAIQMGKVVYTYTDPAPNIKPNTAAQLSTQVNGAIRRIAYMCALHEKLIMKCYYDGRKYTTSDFLLVLRTLKGVAGERFDQCWHLSDQQLQYHKSGQNVLSLATGTVETPDQVGTIRSTTTGFSLGGAESDDDTSVEKEEAKPAPTPKKAIKKVA